MKQILGGAAGVALAAGLAGCGGVSLGSLNPWGAPAERSRALPADAVNYACDGGRRLVVRYLAGEGAVMIVFPEREFRLDPVSAGGERRYSNGRTVLSGTPDQVALTEDKETPYSNCKRTLSDKP